MAPRSFSDAVALATDYWRGDAMCGHLKNAARICEVPGHMKLTYATAPLAASWLTKLRVARTPSGSGLSIATQRSYYAALKRCFTLAGVNVSLWPKAPKQPRVVRREPLSESDVIRCLDYLQALASPTLALAQLVLSTGMRGSEATKERGQGWHVKLAAESHTWIRVKGKGGHERDVTVLPNPGDHMWGWWETEISMLTLKEHRANWLAACTFLGIESRLPTLHALRHVFATRLYRRCKDIALVQRQLGHADPSTTMTYIGHQSDRDVALMLAAGDDEEAN